MFADCGFEVFTNVLSDRVIESMSQAADDLISRHRRADPLVVQDAISVSDVTARHPDRNPGVQPIECGAEPFIIGDVLRHDRRFMDVLIERSLWRCVAACLGADVSKLVFHFSNLTMKPAFIGPGVGWHRDCENTFFAAADARTARALMPLDPMDEGNAGTAIAVGSDERVDCRDPNAFEVVHPEVSPGSILVLGSRLLHGGAPNRSDRSRRLLVMQFGVCGSTLSHSTCELHSLSTHEALERAWAVAQHAAPAYPKRWTA
jgi:ectoine hydroxylase-related dioxygenase (phytanoyl-CoA dioxygenase family)